MIVSLHTVVTEATMSSSDWSNNTALVTVEDVAAVFGLYSRYLTSVLVDTYPDYYDKLLSTLLVKEASWV